MNKMQERHYRQEFEEKFDHEMNSIEYAILTSPDYVQWLIDSFFTDFKKPGELTSDWLARFADSLNCARQMRQALKIPDGNKASKES